MRSSKQKSSLLPLFRPPFSQLLVLMADDEISNHLLRKPLELLPELLHGGLIVLLDARSQLTWGLLAVAATGGAAERVSGACIVFGFLNYWCCDNQYCFWIVPIYLLYSQFGWTFPNGARREKFCLDHMVGICFLVHVCVFELVLWNLLGKDWKRQFLPQLFLGVLGSYLLVRIRLAISRSRHTY